MAWIYDRLINLASSLGTRRDKATYNTFALELADKGQLDAAFRSDWLSRKVVEIPAKDMTRAWRRWFANKDQIEALENEEKRLQVRAKVFKAELLGRLYGGALLYMSDGTADQSQPLNVDTLGTGGLKYLHVFNRWEVGSGGEANMDIASPYFGGPQMYTLTMNQGLQIPIHPSRVIKFTGAPIPDWTVATDGWGDPVLNAMLDAIKNSASSQQNVASLIEEAVVDVITVPGLANNLSTTDATSKTVSRFGLAAMMKSNNGMLLIGDGETFDQKAINFQSLPDVIKTFLQIVAGAADIPVTRLLGASPTGMNATGESDTRNYYDKISGDQETDLRPAMAPLDELLIRSALGSRPKEIYYEFNKLWQMDDVQRSQISKTKAETANIYANAGLIPEAVLQHAVLNDLEETGTYPGIVALNEEFEANQLKPLVEEPEPMELPPGAPGVPALGSAVNPAEVDPNPRGEPSTDTRDAAPMPVYVFRSVLNWREIDAWAKAQGFTDTLGADMHVTIAYSVEPVDWMKIAPDYEWDKEPTMTMPAGGPRLMDQFNEATVLLFSSSRLSWRHCQIKDAGASWDYPDYQPHITITTGAAPDLKTVEPYQGRIVLGQETFQPLDVTRRQ